MSEKDEQTAIVADWLMGLSNIVRGVLFFLLELLQRLFVVLGVIGIVAIITCAVWYAYDVSGLRDTVEILYLKNK